MLGIQTIVKPDEKSSVIAAVRAAAEHRSAGCGDRARSARVLKVIAGEVRFKPSADAPITAPKITLPVANASQMADISRIGAMDEPPGSHT